MNRIGIIVLAATLTVLTTSLLSPSPSAAGSLPETIHVCTFHTGIIQVVDGIVLFLSDGSVHPNRVVNARPNSRKVQSIEGKRIRVEVGVERGNANGDIHVHWKTVGLIKG